jgi:hypothetical protein
MAAGRALKDITTMTELVAGVVDYGDAPEIYVTGPARVCMLSSGLLRMSYYADRDRHDGDPERRIVLHVLRDLTTVMADLPRIAEAIELARLEGPRHHCPKTAGLN